MTLLKELQDSEQGLIGITEQEERIHLGSPTVYSAMRDYGYRSFKEAVKAFCYSFIRDMQDKQRYERINELEESFRKDQEAYWFFNSDAPYSHARNDLSFCHVYLRFEKDKQEAFQREWESSYPDKRHENYIKIHRAT